MAYARNGEAPMMFIVNEARSFGGSFDKFVATMSAAAVSVDRAGAVIGNARVNCSRGNENVVGDPNSYGTRSPYLYSKWSSGTYHVYFNGKGESIDFSDLARPKRIVGQGPDFSSPEFAKAEEEIIVSR